MKKILASLCAAAAITATSLATAPAADAVQVPPSGGCGIVVKSHHVVSVSGYTAYDVDFSQTCGLKVKAFYHGAQPIGPTTWFWGNVRTTPGDSQGHSDELSLTRCSSGYEWSVDGKTWTRVPLEKTTSACS